MADIRKRTGMKGTTYQVRYACPSTKSGYAFKTFSTVKAAKAFIQSGKTLEQGDGHHSDIQSVPQAVDLWLDICEKVGRDGRETVEPQTLVEYKRRADVIKEYRWTVKLQNIQTRDIVQFRTWLLENKSRDLARRTLSSLHSILIEMKVQGHIDHDPASGVTVRSNGRHEATEVEIPTDEEIRAILSATEQLMNKNERERRTWRRYRPMIYLAVFSGLRPSEYRGLTWDNVSERSVSVTQRADKNGLIGPVKSRAALRTVYLPQFVTEMIFSWRKYCPSNTGNLVFPTAGGKPMALGKIRKYCWLPLLKEAGLLEVSDEGVIHNNYKMYCLRHYYASKLIESGKDAKFIQKMMGHSTIELTFNVYGHLIGGKEEEYENAAEEVAASILGQDSCGKNVASVL